MNLQWKSCDVEIKSGRNDSVYHEVNKYIFTWVHKLTTNSLERDLASNSIERVLDIDCR